MFFHPLSWVKTSPLCRGHPLQLQVARWISMPANFGFTQVCRLHCEGRKMEKEWWHWDSLQFFLGWVVEQHLEATLEGDFFNNTFPKKCFWRIPTFLWKRCFARVLRNLVVQTQHPSEYFNGGSGWFKIEHIFHWKWYFTFSWSWASKHKILAFDWTRELMESEGGLHDAFNPWSTDPISPYNQRHQVRYACSPPTGHLWQPPFLLARRRPWRLGCSPKFKPFALSCNYLWRMLHNWKFCRFLLCLKPFACGFSGEYTHPRPSKTKFQAMERPHHPPRPRRLCWQRTPTSTRCVVVVPPVGPTAFGLPWTLPVPVFPVDNWGCEKAAKPGGFTKHRLFWREKVNEGNIGESPDESAICMNYRMGKTWFGSLIEEVQFPEARHWQL